MVESTYSDADIPGMRERNTTVHEFTYQKSLYDPDGRIADIGYPRLINTDPLFIDQARGFKIAILQR